MSEVLEKGNVYFFYRPRVEETEPEQLEDVQRLYVVLEPHGSRQFRRIVIGQKKLPEIGNGGEKYWGFVDLVDADADAVRAALEREEYETKTRGTRTQPAARPAGEGVYQIVQHEDHTHLAYALELPDERGPVQREMHIENEASYVISVKNPAKGSPRTAGLGRAQKAEYPEALMDAFEDRRFNPVNPTAFLDHEGAELLLIGADEDAEAELEIALDPQAEDEQHAEIIRNLHLSKDAFEREPLLTGEWS